MTTDDLRQALDLLDDRTASDGEHAVARQVITAQVAALTAERERLRQIVYAARLVSSTADFGVWGDAMRDLAAALLALDATTPPAGAQGGE